MSNEQISITSYFLKHEQNWYEQIVRNQYIIIISETWIGYHQDLVNNQYHYKRKNFGTGRKWPIQIVRNRIFWEDMNNRKKPKWID